MHAKYAQAVEGQAYNKNLALFEILYERVISYPRSSSILCTSPIWNQAGNNGHNCTMKVDMQCFCEMTVHVSWCSTQNGDWAEGEPETDAEAESERHWREGDLLQLTSRRKQGARQLWGKGFSQKRANQKGFSWFHQAKDFVGQSLGVAGSAK